MTAPENGPPYDVSSQVLEILSTQDDPSAPIRLTTLGQALREQFDLPMKEILGDRRLSDVLRQSLAGKIVWEGSGSTLSIRLVHAQKFDSSFWAAFAKPIPPGRRRFLRVIFPFSFRDETDPIAKAEQNEIEVSASEIPDAALPNPERRDQIKSAIKNAAERNGLDIRKFLDLSGNHATSVAAQRSVLASLRANERGVLALISMIEIVPASERKDHHLSLDLIYRLIGR